MRIGELSRISGISTRMLRHYDAMGLVSPERRPGNDYRDYTDADIERLFRVEGLRSLGLPLQAIRDNYEKAILSMDQTYITDHEGIKLINIIDFLMG